MYAIVQITTNLKTYQVDVKDHPFDSEEIVKSRAIMALGKFVYWERISAIKILKRIR